MCSDCKKLKITEEERCVDEAEPLSPAGMRDQGSEYLGTFQGCVDFCCLTLLERISNISLLTVELSARNGRVMGSTLIECINVYLECSVNHCG